MSYLQPDVRPGLDWLVAPLSPRDFLDEYWDQRPMHLISERGPAVFDSAALERVIEIAQPQAPTLRLAAQGKEPMAVPVLKSGWIDLVALRQAFLDGYTIIVNNVQLFHPGLQELVQTLKTQTSYGVEANTYFTPPGAQGFHPHYDSHHVFVVQCEGAKEWKVYGEQAAREPHEFVNGDPFDRGDLPEPVTLTLNAGDVLYIPRGWVHEAETRADVASLHVTLGVHVKSGLDLMHAAIDAMGQADPTYLRALPFGFLDQGGESCELRAMFDDLAGRLERAAPVATAHAYLHDQLIQGTRPTNAVGLFDLGARLEDISIATCVERNTYVAARLVDGGESLVLQYLSQVLELPCRFGPAVQFILRQQAPFTVGQLPGLDASDQQQLAESLVTDGLLRLP